MPDKLREPGRLFALKEWLTLEEAAKHLSLIFSEEVSVPDVLRLVLDKRLKLSVLFVNHTYATQGRLKALAHCRVSLFPAPHTWGKPLKLPEQRTVTRGQLSEIDSSIKEMVDAGDINVFVAALKVDGDQYLELEGPVVSIKGVWDLPLWGAEYLDVEHRYHQETGGPEVTLQSLDGAFVVRGDVVCQLQTSFEASPYQPGSRASGDSLRAEIRRKDIAEERAAELLEQHRADREKFLKSGHRYFPAGGPPEDAVWVIKTSAINGFVQSVADDEHGPAKPLADRERTTLLNVIGGLAGLMLAKTPAGKPQSVFRDQAAIIDAMLATYDGSPGISKRTLEQKLAAAKKSLSE